MLESLEFDILVYRQSMGTAWSPWKGCQNLRVKLHGMDRKAARYTVNSDPEACHFRAHLRYLMRATHQW
jgi:hypothetical protein